MKKKTKRGYINKHWNLHWIGMNDGMLFHDMIKKKKEDHPEGVKVEIIIQEIKNGTTSSTRTNKTRHTRCKKG